MEEFNNISSNISNNPNYNKQSNHSKSPSSEQPKIVEIIHKTELDYKTKYTGNEELDRNIFLTICKESLKNDFTDEVNTKINLAIDLVFEAFRSSKPREDGSRVYTHFFETAEILIKKFNILTLDAIISAILHDGPEDAPETITFKVIKELFGTNVSEIVQGVTKITSETELFEKGITDTYINHKLNYDELEIASILKITTYGVKQPLVYFVKFADRFHNILTLYGKKNPQRRRALAEQTLHIYIPLMKKLDCIDQARELSDLCLMHIVADDKTNALKILKQLRKIHEEQKNKFLNVLRTTRIKINNKSVQIPALFELFFPKLLFLVSHNSLYDLYRAVSRHQFSVPPDYSHFFVILETQKQNKNEILITISNVREVLKTYFNFRNEESEILKDDDFEQSNYEKTLHTFWVSTPKNEENLKFELRLQPSNIELTKFDRRKFTMNAKYSITKEDLNAYMEIISDLINSPLKNKLERAFYFFDKLYPKSYVAVDLYNNQTRYLLPKGSIALDLAFKVGFNYGRRFVSANKINPETNESQNLPLDYRLNDNDIIELILSQNENTFSTTLDFLMNSVYTLTAYNELRKLKVMEITSNLESIKKSCEKTVTKTIKLGGKDKFQLSQQITKLGHNNQINFTAINMGTTAQNPSYWEGELKLTAPNETAINYFILGLLEFTEIEHIEII
ncbi:MAG: HD domain-containing protein [Candidatus Kapaibacteriales bacterium]